eukprot:Hpha_TRINITY_DN30135_c0_g1::TRINITY_DN30135_c0_g1_i1::g.110611::m.110611
MNRVNQQPKLQSKPGPAATWVADPDGGEGEEDAPPHYWVPGDKEQGLMQVVSLLKSSNGAPLEVFLSSRPVDELRANFTDHSRQYIDLSTEPWLSGANVSRQNRQLQNLPPGTNIPADHAHSYLNSLLPCSDAFLVVRYCDYSSWAAKAFKNDRQGRFGRHAEGGFFGVFLNPLMRKWVEKSLVVRIGERPAAIVAELTEFQFAAAACLAHTNRITAVAQGRVHSISLSEHQLEQVLALTEPPPPLPDTTHLDWVVGPPRTWGREQSVAVGFAGVLMVAGMVIGARGELPPSAAKVQGLQARRGMGGGVVKVEVKEAGTSSFRGFLWMADAMLRGATTALLCGACTGRGVQRYVPWAGISAGLVMLPLLHASPSERAFALSAHLAAIAVAACALARKHLL